MLAMNRIVLSVALVVAALLSGCDMLGIETPEKIAAARDADGRAIGGACRHAGRAIEDCYSLNRRADRAAVFAGWRDMNDYMRENKIDSVSPQLTAQVTTRAAVEPEPPAEKPAADKSQAKTKEGKERKASKESRESKDAKETSGEKSTETAGS